MGSSHMFPKIILIYVLNFLERLLLTHEKKLQVFRTKFVHIPIQIYPSSVTDIFQLLSMSKLLWYELKMIQNHTQDMTRTLEGSELKRVISAGK